MSQRALLRAMAASGAASRYGATAPDIAVASREDDADVVAHAKRWDAAVRKIAAEQRCTISKAIDAAMRDPDLRQHLTLSKTYA